MKYDKKEVHRTIKAITGIAALLNTARIPLIYPNAEQMLMSLSLIAAMTIIWLLLYRTENEFRRGYREGRLE